MIIRAKQTNRFRCLNSAEMYTALIVQNAQASKFRFTLVFTKRIRSFLISFHFNHHFIFQGLVLLEK